MKAIDLKAGDEFKLPGEIAFQLIVMINRHLFHSRKESDRFLVVFLENGDQTTLKPDTDVIVNTLKPKKMMYKILESHCIYAYGKLNEVAVLWDDNGFVRGTYISKVYHSGHAQLIEEGINDKLLQRAAGYGIYIDDDRKKKYFPGKRNWSR